MIIWLFLSQIEDTPHDILACFLIGDFLYGDTKEDVSLLNLKNFLHHCWLNHRDADVSFTAQKCRLALALVSTDAEVHVRQNGYTGMLTDIFSKGD